MLILWAVALALLLAAGFFCWLVVVPVMRRDARQVRVVVAEETGEGTRVRVVARVTAGQLSRFGLSEAEVADGVNRMMDAVSQLVAEVVADMLPTDDTPPATEPPPKKATPPLDDRFKALLAEGFYLEIHYLRDGEWQIADSHELRYDVPHEKGDIVVVPSGLLQVVEALEKIKASEGEK
jgi:hypothetical protein